MEFGWSPAENQYREEIHSFIDSDLAENPRSTRLTEIATQQNIESSLQFTAKLAARGWLTPHWPVEYGGSDATAWKHIILTEEMWVHGELRGPQYMNVNWIGPAIMQSGTPEQKAYHLPRIMAGDVIWCQGFSEPAAGSDLASLRTCAVRDGDEYIVNGEKIWTSYANSAEFCLLLVRTDPIAERHHGITILLTPTNTPGFEVRDVPSVLGEHALHHLTFTDMHVPVSCRLGEENDGWPVIRRALSYERLDTPRYARAALMLDELVRWAAAHGRLDGGTKERVAIARANCEAARLLAYRVMDDRSKERDPGSRTNVARAALVQADRAVGELGFDLLGAAALVMGSVADEQFRSALPGGIGAGTLEMQLTLISRGLGLPGS